MYEDILKDLESNLSFTYGNNITQYDSGYICDVFSEIADSNVDIYTSDLFDWGKNNMYYIDEATKEFGDPHDILRQIQQGQYYAYEQELYENKDDIIKYFAYTYLNDNNIKLNVEQEEDLDDYLSSVDSNDKLEDIIDYCKNINKDYELA
ncbi:MAG: hypothetical protein J6A15_06750 [Clostridia bacterium]|jgi:hypothetical protein|nr:hypothetical protein [Clostridia bacterium]